MSDRKDDKTIKLTDEFADIFASVFGDGDTPDSADAQDEIAADILPTDNHTYDEPAYSIDENEEYFEEDYSESGSDPGMSPDDECEAVSETEEGEYVFDSRFKIGQRNHSKFSYGGHIVNEGADADYSRPVQPDYQELHTSYYVSEYDDVEGRYSDEEVDSVESGSGFSLFRRRRRKPEATESEYPSYEPDDQFQDDREEYNRTGEYEEDGSLPDEQFSQTYQSYDLDDDETRDISFKQYLASRFAGLIFKLRGTVPEGAVSATMVDEDEPLGPELDALDASNYYGSFIKSLRKRTLAAAVLLIVSLYISLGLPVAGMLQSLKIAVCAVMAIQFTIMLLALDVATNAVLNAFRGKFGIDSLAVLSCIMTSLDALVVIKFSGTATHMPLCAVSSMSLFGVLLSSMWSTRGIRKALRVPAIGKSTYSVTGEQDIIPNGITLLKSTRPINGFVRRMEETPLDEENYRKVSPFILLLSVVFSALTAAVTSNFDNLLYIFTLLLAPAVPFTALMCFSLPFFIGSFRIFGSGSAIAGWSGTYDIGHSKNLIVTDRDLFPDNCISIENVRIFADYESSKVISYAGAMVRASQCGLTGAFESLMQENRCAPAELDTFECLSGGGFKSLIEGHEVYCGNIDVMRLMNIKTPYRLISKNSVLLSVDGILYGIFNISYKPDPKVRKALVSLMRSNRHPVFAVRDFNITPDMIHDCFDIATDGYDFPPYVDRFPLSEAKPSNNSRISAVICREGLGPLTAMADTGRSIFVTTKINTAISIFSSLLWLVFALVKILASGQISILFIILYSLVFTVPILILGAATTSAN